LDFTSTLSSILSLGVSEREEVIIQGGIISDNSPTGGSYPRGHLINGFEAIIWEIA